MKKENVEQKEFVKWFRGKYPQYAHCIRVSLSGLNFGPGARGARTMAYIKGQGIHPGESDIAIMLKRGKFGSFLAEHKCDDGDYGVTDDQLEYLEQHRAVGNCAVSTRGLEVLKAAVTQYIELEDV